MQKLKSKSGRKNIFHRLTSNLYVRLDINPSDAVSQDDKITLYSTDSLESYKKTVTVKDDYVSGDDYVDLLFEDLNKELKYTLEVNPGEEGEPYTVFKNVSFIKLSDLSPPSEEDNESEEEDEQDPPPDEEEGSKSAPMEEDTGNEIEYEDDEEESVSNDDIKENEEDDEEEEEMEDEIPEGVECPFAEDD